MSSSEKDNIINSRLSLLGKELYENMENLILGENILGNYFQKRNLDKKTIYSSNKLKLNIDELNSDSTSVEKIFIEEKKKFILFKGTDQEQNQQNENQGETPETQGETIIEKNEDDFDALFDAVEQGVDADIEKKCKANNDNNDNNGNNNDINNNKNEINNNKNEINDNKDINKEENTKDNSKDNSNNSKDSINDNYKENENDNDDKDKKESTLIQDISDYNQEQKENNAMDDIYDIYSDDDNYNERKESIEEKEKLEREKKELEEQEKKKEILKEEYYPIDIIEESEKYYNLSNESKEDLYPLNTYQLNNGLSIDFLKYKETNISTQISGSITVIGSDHENNLYICTNNGKIIKKGKDEIIFQNEKKQEYKESISCIDIVDTLVVTGDDNGNIAIWSNNNLSRVLPNVNDGETIICIKIIELIGNHLTLVFSGVKGNFNLIKAHISKNHEIKNYELEYEYTPIYNILLFPNSISYIKSEKQNIIMLLVSPQYIGICRLYPENRTLEKLITQKYFYDEEGAFIFDVSSGFGFPPVSDLNKGRLGFESNSNYRGSISNNIVIRNEDEETLMISISYGNVIQIFGIVISDKNNVIKPIGFIINDKPIIRNCFISNSMIAIITEDLNIKLINTYDFTPKVYNLQEDQTVSKNFLLAYEYLNIKSGISEDWIDFSVNNKRIQKKIYNNKIIVNDNSIYYITDDGKNLQRICLSNYDEVLSSLCDKEDYIRMLWLLSIITNKKTNLLNKQLNKIDKHFKESNKKSLIDLYLMRFFTTKTIPELQKSNEIYARMLLEFFIEIENFEAFLKYMDILKNFELDHYIYSNLTKYIINGSLSEILINNIFINNYIEYCMSKNEKLLLNKVLLKLNLETLLQKEVLNIISEKELINPYIYTCIKNIKLGKIDYFLPLLYLDFIFKKDKLMKMNEEMIQQYLIPEQLELFKKQLSEKKEEIKEDSEKKLNISNDYRKLITEHNINYFNEDTFSCNEYIGHKFFWYCNKCLSGKEYPNDTQMSPNNFKETAVKILAFLTKKENLKIYLEFDSYTFLQIISQYFFNEKLFNIIYGYEQNYSQQTKDFINICLGENADKDFNAFKVYMTIKDSLNNVDMNRYFLKYDFYVMTCEICQKVRDFIFEIKDIKNSLNYFSSFDLEDYKEEKDPYNCHRKIEGDKEIKKFKEKIEKYMINLLNYLKSYNLLTKEFAKEIIAKPRIFGYKKVYFYLSEELGNYKECLKLKILEFDSKKDLYNEKDKKELFSWIIKIHHHTLSLDKQAQDQEEKKKEEQNNKEKENEEQNNKEKKKEEKKNKEEKKKEEKKSLNKEFKDDLLNHLNKLCFISIEKLSQTIDECFEGNEIIEIIRHLGEGQSIELQLKYIDVLFKRNEKEGNENIDMEILEIALNNLIQNRNKRRIKKLLMKYKVLCNDKIFRILEKNRINDSCIYICQQQHKVKEGVALTIKEVKQKYKNIIEILNKPNFNPKLIELELNEMYKYFQLGLNVCQNNFLDENKEEKQIDNSWLDLFNTACEFKIMFYPRYESNKNNNKTLQHKKIFNGLQNCIQLILETMSDYITLNLLVGIIAENCKKWKSIEFYTFLDKSFYSFRRSEQILKCAKNLMSTSILIHYDEISELKTLGDYVILEQEKCDFCKFKIKAFNDDSYILFLCGHKYHINCCWKENNIKSCYLCNIGNIDIDKEKAKKIMEAQPKSELSYLEQEKLEKEQLKKEERERKKGIKNKIAALQKIKKKRKEIDAYLIKNEIYN